MSLFDQNMQERLKWKKHELDATQERGPEWTGLKSRHDTM